MTFRDHLMHLDIFHYLELLKALVKLMLNTSRDG